MDEDIYLMTKVVHSIEDAINSIESLDFEGFQDELTSVQATLEDLITDVEYAINNAERLMNDYA